MQCFFLLAVESGLAMPGVSNKLGVCVALALVYTVYIHSETDGKFKL